MARLKAFWDLVKDSLWFVPAVMTLIGVGLAILLVRVDVSLIGTRGDAVPFLFSGGPEGARGVLGAIAGSIITVTGVVFSVTIVALQLASTQFTPRVLQQFMADRANQLVLGVFIGTFTYTLLVQRTVRAESGGNAEFVPDIAVAGAILLALLSIAFLIFFIDHVARSIQAEAIIDRVARDTARVIERVTDVDENARIARPHAIAATGPPTAVAVGRAGYIQRIDEGGLLEIARDNALTIRVDRTVGGFVWPGDSVLEVWPADRVDDDVHDRLGGAVVLGSARTPHQDIELGIIELVDITAKALSPAVNDPTTAIIATNRLAELVLLLGQEGRREIVRLEEDDGCLIARRYSFRRICSVAFDQIRTFGAENPTFMTHLLETLGRIASRLPAARRRPLLHQMTLIGTAGERQADLRTDRRRVRRAATNAARSARAMAAAVLVITTVAAVPRHLQLRASVPAKDASLDAVPTAIELIFSEPVEPSVANVTVEAPAGASVLLDPPAAGDSAQVIVARWTSDVVVAGAYTVRWQVIGRDGHPVAGEYRFTLTSAAAASAAPPVPEPRIDTAAAVDPGMAGADPGTAPARDPTGSPTFVAIRWLTYLSIVLALGAVGFRAIVIGGLRRAPVLNAETFAAPAASVAAGIGAGAFGFVLLAALARLLAQQSIVASMTGVGIGDLLLETTWGQAWIGQVVAAGLGLGSLRLARGGSEAGWAGAAAAGVAIAISQALSGHAAATDPVALAVGLDALHLLAVAGWIGTLFYLFAVGLPQAAGTRADRNTALVAGIVGLFSPRALALAGLVVATGIATASLQLGSVSALVGTDYGRMLLVKLAVVLVVIGAGTFNWRRLRPRLEMAGSVKTLRRSAVVELAAAALVLLVTAILVALPTP